MAGIDETTFLMGTDDPAAVPGDGEGPVRSVNLDPFFMDPAVVTNAEFGAFVKQTGYVTEAERFGWSFVFHLLVPPDIAHHVVGSVPAAPWWIGVKGADWRHPEGPGSTVGSRQNHPVVHISWNDAEAYAYWAGKRLPSEAEWECAARGGLEQCPYPWGDEIRPNGVWRCNIWQGRFPIDNSREDGYLGTAPARSYQPNGFGLYNTVGNVWEWVADWYSTNHPPGELVDPTGPERGEQRVSRGGSYLCHDSYCNRYRVSARSSLDPQSSTSNTGFRCAADAN